MWRRSSPGWYSRRAWKATSLEVRSRVGVALEVADEAGAGGGHPDGPRMHEQLDRLGPDQLAAHETDRVGADRAHRADRTRCRVARSGSRTAGRARRPCGGSGWRARRVPAPIGTSTFDAEDARRRSGWRRSTVPSAASPTTTRRCGSAERHAIRGATDEVERPRRSTSTTPAQPIATSSIQPSR